MTQRLCVTLALSLLLVSLTARAEEYTGLGVSREAVKEMLDSEGLDPLTNNYPDDEGDKVTELMIYQPFVTVTMYGPDHDLNTIEMTTMPSTDESENYYQGLISLWLLDAAFPDWASSDRWFDRAVESVTGTNASKASVTRNGKTAEVILDDAYFYLTLNGQSADHVAATEVAPEI